MRTVTRPARKAQAVIVFGVESTDIWVIFIPYVMFACEPEIWELNIFFDFHPRLPNTNSVPIFSWCGNIQYERHTILTATTVQIQVPAPGNIANDLVRVRSMRGVGFSREWHQLRLLENFEVTLDK
jgi:hypothetical protein